MDRTAFLSPRPRAFGVWIHVFITAGLFLSTSSLYAQGEEVSSDALKKLSIEELMNIEVTSVSKRAEKLLETPSAVQVVTGDDISKFGATNIPEALYLAGNLQTTQKGSHSWGISSRGFNTDLGNKLLVLIDGRAVYTPLFSGVFWDRQDYLLNDINQIEVISGPGGTLWGANAVNGVISVTSKSARETQGLYLEGGAGNEINALGGLRYGGKIAPNVYYRVYGKYAGRESAIYPDSIDATDAWKMGQGGFRIDAEPSSRTTFTLQGDLYNNTGDLPTGGTAKVIGGNILGRWSHRFADSSDMRLQAYYDRTDFYDPTAPFINAPAGVFQDVLDTYDLDFQHRFNIGSWNHLVWGLGYRFTHDEVVNSPALAFFPVLFEQSLYSCFVQDEINLGDALTLTAGTKLEHNAYTGYVLEPNIRIKGKINEKNIVWGAVSRAVRTPSRVDRNFIQAPPPYFSLLAGSENFMSEILVAFEVGYRGQLGEKTTASASLYFNDYDHLRTTIPNPGPFPFPLRFSNGMEGESYGAELSVTSHVTNWWRLFTSYNYMRYGLWLKPNETDFSQKLNENADPKHQFLFRSSFLLPHRISISAAFRWIDRLKTNAGGGLFEYVPTYADVDGQVAWEINDHLTLSVSGRNFLKPYHIEYGAGPDTQAVQRTVYGKIALKF